MCVCVCVFVCVCVRENERVRKRERERERDRERQTERKRERERKHGKRSSLDKPTPGPTEFNTRFSVYCVDKYMVGACGWVHACVCVCV